MSQKNKVLLLVKALSELALTTDINERKRLTEKIRTLNDELTPDVDKKYTTVFCRPLTFNEKDVARMPKTFVQANGIKSELSTHIRKRYYITESYEITYHYEIRYRANGYNVTACANTLPKAKKRFIHKLFCLYCKKGDNSNE